MKPCGQGADAVEAGGAEYEATQRILITNDKGDFGELVFKDFHPHAGVILLRRMKPGDMQAKLDGLTYVLEAYANRLNHFLVVTPTNVRVKKTLMRKAA